MMRALVLSFCILLTQGIFAQEAVDTVRPADEPASETLDTAALLVETLTELAELRRSVDRLQRTLDDFMANVTAQLLGENPRPRVMPNEADEPPIAETPIAEPDAIAEALPLASPEFGYTVVKEWGRSPEMAASFPTAVSTMKGMVLLVSPSSTDEQLIDLGEELRALYGDYDNVNIEVFDDAASAQRFADEGVTSDPRRRVLTVSKYRASGRDLVLLNRGDSVTVVNNGE